MNRILLAKLDSELERCFAVIRELRPHLIEADFVNQIRRQEQQGYQMIYLEAQEDVKAVAGFRISENLAWGKFLYVDDLITQAGNRSQGYGNQLFNWLVDYARSQNCQQFHLDSGVQRFEAHRFYFRQRMSITSYHFGLKL
jgi:GNAT superfamily N-acetyltransferase